MKSLTVILAEHPSVYNPALIKPWVCIGCNENGVNPVFATHKEHAAHVAAVWRDTRTVRAAEEADALPRFTLIEHRGVPMRKNDGGWDSLSTGIRHHEAPLPALVLWVSDEAGA